jgi:hypothetical protein
VGILVFERFGLFPFSRRLKGELLRLRSDCNGSARWLGAGALNVGDSTVVDVCTLLIKLMRKSVSFDHASLLIIS